MPDPFGIFSTIIQQFDRRIRIKVSVVPGFTVGTVVPQFDKGIVITAANVGMRGTSLGSAYLEFPADRQIALPLVPNQYRYRSAPDPYEFAPGKPDLIIAVDGKYIAAALREEGCSGIIPFRASISGVGGKRYRSKEKLLNTDTGYVSNKP
jgi:hypothetical protein